MVERTRSSTFPLVRVSVLSKTMWSISPRSLRIRKSRTLTCWGFILDFLSILWVVVEFLLLFLVDLTDLGV